MHENEGKIEVWPLRLIDLRDPEQFELLYDLLKLSPHVIHYYLSEVCFIKKKSDWSFFSQLFIKKKMEIRLFSQM